MNGFLLFLKLFKGFFPFMMLLALLFKVEANIVSENIVYTIVFDEKEVTLIFTLASIYVIYYFVYWLTDGFKHTELSSLIKAYYDIRKNRLCVMTLSKLKSMILLEQFALITIIESELKNYEKDSIYNDIKRFMYIINSGQIIELLSPLKYYQKIIVYDAILSDSEKFHTFVKQLKSYDIRTAYNKAFYEGSKMFKLWRRVNKKDTPT